MHALLRAPVASKLRQRLPRPRMGVRGGAFACHRRNLLGAGAIAAADDHPNPHAQPNPHAESKSHASPVADGQHG